MPSFNPASFLTVRVGAAAFQQDFLLHEGIICAPSDFLRRAMDGNWMAKKEHLIKLPLDDPEVFAAYVNLVYTNNISMSGSAQTTTLQIAGDEHSRLCKLYILGEKLQDTAARNAAVVAILEVTHKQDMNGNRYVPNVALVNTLYKGTTEGSLGRRLMVGLRTNQTINSPCQLDNVSRKFLVEPASALRSERAKDRGITALTSYVSQYLESEN